MIEKTSTRLKELEKLVVKEQDYLFRFAYMRVGNRHDAEDIVQDVFLKFFLSGERLSHVRNIRLYLIKSISNRCCDFCRCRKIAFLPIEEVAGISVSDDDGRMYEEYLRIGRLLADLPDTQAEVVRLRCIDGLKFREIAKILDMPQATVKSRFRYAVSRIHKLIDDRKEVI